MNKPISILLCSLSLLLFHFCNVVTKERPLTLYPMEPYLIILGVAQDAGYPQANCKKSCCLSVWGDPTNYQKVVSIGIVDPKENSCWMMEATPDFKDQLHQLVNHRGTPLDFKGVFLTHAHIGHYTGLMHLGHEAMGANSVPVYAMPRMVDFIENNGPWDQLVSLKNIILHPLKDETSINLNGSISIRPSSVPHRDEYSETVGYTIKGGSKTAYFLPDIDKWEKWDKNLIDELKGWDYAFLDGTFYANGELPNRDMSQIPHPFVEESVQLLEGLSAKEKSKVYFIHFNHTNPLLQKGSKAREELMSSGFNYAQEGTIFGL